MNILPHKSWHVRTKKNIARVRKDEKEAAEKEQEKKRKIARAEQEVKIDILRKRARGNQNASGDLPSTSSKSHVNFFSDVESGKYVSELTGNAENAQEKKDEQEKYEKQIGYLTYLGQSELEAKRSWYDLYPERKRGSEALNEDGSKIEVNLKSKLLQDPFSVMQKYLGYEKSEKKIVEPLEDKTKIKPYESVLGNTSGQKRKSSKKKSKKHKEKKSRKKKSKKARRSSSSSSSSSEDEVRRNLQKQKLEQLRLERLKREQVEREKAENLLARLRGEQPEKEVKKSDIPAIRQKYNSQFNPDIARQNTE